MSSFVYPSLLWGLTLVGVPVLIHLINLLRHRRVQWAAMEFLLASRKRNRTRVLLKQLLLLLLRMLAVAGVVTVLAQPLLENRLGSMFGESKTHHIVLLDDSFSMSDRRADTDAFQEAKVVVERIGAQAARQAQPQTFTLLRYSRAVVSEVSSSGVQPDMLQRVVDTEFPSRLRATLEPFSASHSAAGPLAALSAITQLVDDSAGDRHIIYLISDFRARQWEDPTELRNQLARLNHMGAKLHLINCVEAARANLAITDLSPGDGTRAAGVPLFMDVTVKNFGTAPVKDVPVLIEAEGQPRRAVKIPRIPPGEAVKERFQVHFPTAGQHVITTRLETDAVAADNSRYSFVALADHVPVLIIDGDPEAADARYLSAALAPGGPVPTGITPRIETPRYLSLNPLDSFGVIYLANIERLDESAVEALESYVRSGGGVGVFLGERCRSKFINESLYREGKGFFPVPVSGRADLPVDRLQKAPDLEVGRHPIFRVFGGKRNSFLSTVIVRRYFAIPEDWRPEPGSTTQVIARLRNGAPLAVERNFGGGRVVAFLTTAAPTWNNWARNNPSFVVAMLEMQAFLAGRPAGDVSKLVGTPIEIQLDPAEYEAEVRFVTPNEEALRATGVTPVPPDEEALRATGVTPVPPASANAAPKPDGSLSVVLPGADRSGIYEATLSRKDGTEEVRRFAFNVDAEEGDLACVGGPHLAERLKGVDYQYEPAALFQYAGEELAGYNMSEPLLYALALLLIGEQVLAWSASYHPRSRGGTGVTPVPRGVTPVAPGVSHRAKEARA